MNTYLLEKILTWPRPYLTGTEICLILNKSPDARYAMIKRAVKEGLLISIRRDLYLIKNHSKIQHIDLYSMAYLIYGPSYVSFESALSFHGWIPEAVRTITCATIKKKKEFDTPLGIFSYHHIPISAFPFGLEARTQNGFMFNMANPWKALADMIYVQKRNWSKIEDLSEDLRIEKESLENSNLSLLTGLIANYPSARVQKILNSFQKELFK